MAARRSTSLTLSAPKTEVAKPKIAPERISSDIFFISCSMVRASRTAGSPHPLACRAKARCCPSLLAHSRVRNQILFHSARYPKRYRQLHEVTTCRPDRPGILAILLRLRERQCHPGRCCELDLATNPLVHPQ